MESGRKATGLPWLLLLSGWLAAARLSSLLSLGWGAEGWDYLSLSLSLYSTLHLFPQLQCLLPGVKHLSRCPLALWSPRHCLSHCLTPTSPHELWLRDSGPLQHLFVRRFLLWLLFTSFSLTLIPQHEGSGSAHTPLMSWTSFVTVFLSFCFLKGCTNQPSQSWYLSFGCQPVSSKNIACFCSSSASLSCRWD